MGGGGRAMNLVLSLKLLYPEAEGIRRESGAEKNRFDARQSSTCSSCSSERGPAFRAPRSAAPQPQTGTLQDQQFCPLWMALLGEAMYDDDADE